MAAVARRVRFNLSLTLVVGALGVTLPTLGLLGVVGLVVGVLPALVYTSIVVSYLFGEYANLTNEVPPRRRLGNLVGRVL